jgi:hypothetical protein
MPQFDIFSFFSQLFWVFVGFYYLYLALSLYILPSFAAILKVRAKKLAVADSSSSTSNLVVQSTANYLFFDTILTKINSLTFVRNNLANSIDSKFLFVLFKYVHFGFFSLVILKQIKILSFFV